MSSASIGCTSRQTLICNSVDAFAYSPSFVQSFTEEPPIVLPQLTATSAGPACPAFDDVVGTYTATYNPDAVNWKGVIADLKAVGQAEPRFCTFAIRTHFHDAAAVGVGVGPAFNAQSTVAGGSDGSIVTDTETSELSNHENYGMGAFSRHIIVPIATAHKASVVDVLSVAAAVCTEVMGSPVNIAETCSAAGLPFYVRTLSCYVNSIWASWQRPYQLSLFGHLSKAG